MKERKSSCLSAFTMFFNVLHSNITTIAVVFANGKDNRLFLFHAGLLQKDLEKRIIRFLFFDLHPCRFFTHRLLR